MKNYALSLLLLISSVALHAEDVNLSSKQAIPTKVAYVNINRIMGEDLDKGSDEWRDIVNGLETELKERGSKIQADVQRGQKLEAELRNPAQNKLTSNESRESKTEELMKLQKSVEIAAQAAQSYQNRVVQEAQASIFAKVEKIVNDIAKAQGWDLVIIGGGIYVDPRIDITNAVLDALNKEYKPKKAAAKPAAKPAAKATKAVESAE